MKKFIIVILLSFFILPGHAARMHKEAEYQSKWCTEVCGQKEFILSDKTRIDCLTEKHAIEFDFANKVYEAIGQSLYYAISTNKKPGIVLIVENPQNEQKYIDRMKCVAEKQGIDCWIMYESDLGNFQLRPLE